MSQLYYKTRGMSPVRGKAKIYFSAHPGDHQVFFQKISDTLLKHANCSVWYSGGTISDPETHWDDLEQMQLLVVPVTKRLLTQPNAAMDEEIPFAINKHIPVLPLIQEAGLEMLYQRRFGDLQFLEEARHDATAIPFDVKLQNYLSAIIFREELIRQIHAAFDVRIFLSYRKKDRKHAQELMHLIHSFECCRDIGIWYDEFLTPGEDFNASIRESLEGSDVFAMVVTPNLVNESNYIIMTEYPMAVATRKLLLPVEMVSTDRRLLATKFPGVRDVIQVCDKKALGDALTDMVFVLSDRDRRDSPERRYYIGLGYLTGTGVEIDRKIGISLIQDAAQSGVMQALDMMIEMYRLGFGVERSQEKALMWMQKKIALCRNHYESEPCVMHLNLLVGDLCKYGDQCRAYAKYADAMEQYHLAAQYIAASAFCEDPLISRCLASVCLRMGDISVKKGRVADAGAYIARGVAIMERLVSETGHSDMRKELASSQLALGDIFCMEGKWNAAASCYKECLAFREAYAAQTDTMEARRDLLMTYNRLGIISQEQMELNEARKYFEAALVITEVLVQEDDSITAMRDIAMCYNRLADLDQMEGNGEAALRNGRRNIEVCEEILKESDTVQFRQDLYVSYQRFGDILYAFKKPAQAQLYYEKGHTLCKALYNETDSLDVYADLAASYYRLSKTAPKLQRTILHSKAMHMINKLCKEYPNVQKFRTYRQHFGM